MSETSLNVTSQQNSARQLTLFAVCIRASTFTSFGSESLLKNYLLQRPAFSLGKSVRLLKRLVAGL